MHSHRLEKHHQRRGGFSIEIVISATLILAAIGMMATLIPRIGRSWRHNRNYQLATHELASQLEWLTSLEPKELSDAISHLNLCEALKDELPDAKLSAKTSEEEFGTRIRLEIRWERGIRNDGPSALAMIGWTRSKVSPP